MIILLAIGFVLLTGYALFKGHSPVSVWRMIWPDVKNCSIVMVILLLIGCLTGLWRQNGTVAYFIVAGVGLMPPKLFILFAFLLSAAMSFSIGTSFGVAATAGVILMSIARAGNAALIPVAGAVMSGLYVGDRGSPAASSGALVAAITKTEQRKNIRLMLKTGAVPFALCLLLYTVLSLFFPLEATDTSVTSMLEEAFRLHWICLLPAIVMIVLPFLKVPLKLSMGIDILLSAAIAMLVQGADLRSVLKTAVLGYTPANAALAGMLSGGGIRSMLEVCVILMLSGTYGGLIKGTGLLDGLGRFLSRFRNSRGRFGVMCLISLLCSAVFCNQTIGAIMVNRFSDGMYGDTEEDRYARMLDIEDSVIVIAGLVPWCIASSVPLATLGAGAAALPLAFYLWLIPVCRMAGGLFSKKKGGIG